MEEKLTLDALLAALASDNPDTRTQAMLAAGPLGAAAVVPLAKLVAEGELEVGRAAKRSMWKLVRTAGAPDACPKKKKALVEALLALLNHKQPLAVRREAVWMVSEIGTCDSVDPIAKHLGCNELREDARMVLERIPGDKSLAALKSALESVPADFKSNVAQSLRARGVSVDEKKYPCQKLVPKKSTSVKPVAS